MSRWIILRTSGGQTLPLMRSLRGAGFDVWTPARTVRRSIPAKTLSGKRVIEQDAPILPTFVFAAERDLGALALAASREVSPHPGFRVFHHGGRVPLVGSSEITGLREEEAKEAAVIQSMRAAETHAEAERIRCAAIKSASARRRAEAALERDRRNALRAQRCTVEAGNAVEVIDMPAFAGVAGVLESVDGPYAMVRFGTSSWKIEGWRLMPSLLEHQAA